MSKTIINKEYILDLLFSRITNPEDEHIRAQILIRNKDVGKTSKHTKTFKRYTFSTREDFDKYKDEIINLVLTKEARFYVNPTIKSYEDIGYDLLVETVDRVRHKSFSNLKTLYDSVADRNTGLKDKRIWLIDIDVPEVDSEVLAKIILDLGLNYTAFNKTKNGYHLLIKPMNPKDINQIMEPHNLDYEILKNSQTEVFRIKT